MRKKTATPTTESKSLKTFFLYASLVLFVILVSLTLKTITIIQNSKFDGQHQFVVAIAQDDKVKQIVAFNPGTSVSLLEIPESTVPLSSAGKNIGIPIEGRITVSDGFPWGGNVTDTMTAAAWRYNGIKTDITLYDIIRFILLSKNLSTTTLREETLTFPQEEREVNKIVSSLFTDQTISSENTTIQIINASDTPGMGKRLERMLINMGGNVVAVSTQHKKQTKSQIEYFGKETYTLEKLKRLLQFPVSQLGRETIADIVITIGEDSRGTERF